MMKKYLVLALLATILLMSGCVNDKKEVKKSETTSTEVKEDTKKEDKQEKTLPIEIETAVKDFYQANIDKDYDKIASFYSKQTLDSLQYDTNAVAKWTKDNFEANAINVEKYEVIQFKEVDANHKYLEVDKYYSFGSDKSPAIEKDEWMLVKENNAWKFDTTFVISSEKLKTPEVVAIQDVLSFADFTLDKRVEGLGINATIKNLSKDKNISFEKDTVLTIVTDKGSYICEGLMDKVFIPATGEGTIYMPFKWAEGTPKEIQLKNVFYTDKDGKLTGEKFDATISLLAN